MVSGLLKSYFMRIRLWLEPVLAGAVHVLSIVNALLSFFVVASLVYAFGFSVTLEEAISVGLFKFVFVAFYVEHCVFFITNMLERRVPQHWYYSGSFFLLMTVLIVLWCFPQGMVERYAVLGYAHHDYTLLVLVGIQAVIKFSIMLTDSLSNRLSPNWIFVGSFLLLIIVGAGLLLLPRATVGGISVLDAVFTSVSAVCVTGLSVVDVPTTFTLTGQVMLIVLIQLGGIGIMTFTSFFGLMFAGRHASQNKLLIKDLIDPEKGVSQIFATLRNILLVTFLIEAMGAWGIYRAIGDYSWHGAFVAVFHAVSAFCNAGFSVVPGGLYNPALADNYALLGSISFLIIFGGLGFPILFNIWQWVRASVVNVVRKMFGRQRASVHTPRIITSGSVLVLIITFVLLVVGCVVFFITEYDNVLAGKTWWGKCCTAFFLSVTPRTAGFNSFDMGELRPLTVTYMLIFMWIGGSPMSTAGGIKTTTFGIAVLNIWNTLRGREHIEIRHRSLSQHTVNRAFVIIFVSLVVIAAGVCMMSAFEPQLSMQTVVFEIVSAFATVGLSLNVTPTLTVYSKVLLIFIMFIGRMGLLTLLACFIPESEAKFYRYPTENIAIN